MFDFIRRPWHKLRQSSRHPARASSVFLSYVGVIAVMGFAAFNGNSADEKLAMEARIREADICQVIINVNRNAKFRANTEVTRVRTTKEYLRDTVNDPHSKLRDRVQSTLPIIIAQREQALNNVVATTPPPTCKKYIKGK